jgi:hypothetical protein
MEIYICYCRVAKAASLLRMSPSIVKFSFLLFALLQLSQAVPFEEYIFAPASRDLRPQSVFNLNGSVSGAQGLLQSTGSSTSISGVNSSVTYDFGLNVAGRVRFTVSGNVPASGEVLRLTYSESSLWVTSLESDGTGNGVNVSYPFRNIRLSTLHAKL